MIQDLLSAHAVPCARRERQEGRLVVLQESRVKAPIGLWQEAFRVEDAGFDPVIWRVLYVLQIDTNDIL